MKSGWNSLVVGGCNVIGLTLLALSATAGGSAVRAAGDSPALESIAIEPLTKMVSGLEQRVAAFEASLATFANSLTATRIAARELCVADDSGTQTCITKMQLDGLLKGAMQTAQAAQATQATPEPHHASEQSACPEKCIAPTATVATAGPSEAPPATGLPAVKETAAPDAAGMAAAAREEKASPEQAAGAVPFAPPSVPDQQQAAAESALPVPAETIMSTPRPKPADTAIATTAKPETLIPAEALTVSERNE